MFENIGSVHSLEHTAFDSSVNLHTRGNSGPTISADRMSADALANRLGLSPATVTGPESASFTRRRFRTGDYLFHAGDACRYLYVVLNGCVRTLVTDSDGVERVIGFERCCDTVGLDAIASGHHSTDAIALEPSEFAVIPLVGLSRSSATGGALGHLICQLMSRQITRDMDTMAMMAASRATTRLSAFLLDWYLRGDVRKANMLTVPLPMTRTDIASFLGLTKETISRACSVLDRAGVVAMRRRRFTVLSLPALEELAAGAMTHHRSAASSFVLPIHAEKQPLTCTDPTCEAIAPGR